MKNAEQPVDPNQISFFPDEIDKPAQPVDHYPTLSEKADLFREQCLSISDRIIDGMKAGENWVCPWQKGMPLARNRKSGKYYRGNNLLVLWNQCVIRGFSSNDWATGWQWGKLGARVMKGQRGTMICLAFPKPKGKKRSKTLFDDQGTVLESKKTQTDFRFVYKKVFNKDQVTGFDPLQSDAFEDKRSSQDRIKNFTDALNPTIKHHSAFARYFPRLDLIEMPAPAQFMPVGDATATDHFYATLLHELIHWSGHESRCDRRFHGPFTSRIYAFEELIAEFGSSFLYAHFKKNHIPVQHHSNYVSSWYALLKENPAFLPIALNYAIYATQWLQLTANTESLPRGDFSAPSLSKDQMSWLLAG